MVWVSAVVAEEVTALWVGFGSADVTPDVNADRPVYLAGYGPGRAATGVHDPLMARCLVLRADNVQMAIISVDSIGLQYPTVQKVRDHLGEYSYVVVTSTHNHEAPDVIGLWGPNHLHSGVDPQYLERVVDGCVRAVRQAETRWERVRAEFGTAENEQLLHDSRLPIVKDGRLRVLRFCRTSDGTCAGLLVQWNCHPEALGSRNRLITADFPWATVAALEQWEKCPVVYMSGAVGGLMAPPRGVVRDEQGNLLQEGTFEYAERYGREVARLTQQALAVAKPVQLTPLQVVRRQIHLPVRNPWYRAARAAGVLARESRVWTGDPYQPGDVLSWRNALKGMAVATEVAVMQWGELRLACIPGEIYPELVYGQIQDPVDAGADFPDAPLEPSVTDILGSGPWMLVGLANDEIGYIIPKRQWDATPPYCYARTTSQYGEINSCGPDVAPILMNVLQDCARQLEQTTAPQDPSVGMQP